MMLLHFCDYLLCEFSRDPCVHAGWLVLSTSREHDETLKPKYWSVTLNHGTCLSLGQRQSQLRQRLCTTPDHCVTKRLKPTEDRKANPGLEENTTNQQERKK
eukprot:PhF_6_TR1286/c0_g3_i1/m.2361